MRATVGTSSLRRYRRTRLATSSYSLRLSTLNCPSRRSTSQQKQTSSTSSVSNVLVRMISMKKLARMCFRRALLGVCESPEHARAPQDTELTTSEPTTSEPTCPAICISVLWLTTHRSLYEKSEDRTWASSSRSVVLSHACRRSSHCSRSTLTLATFAAMKSFKKSMGANSRPSPNARAMTVSRIRAKGNSPCSHARVNSRLSKNAKFKRW